MYKFLFIFIFIAQTSHAGELSEVMNAISNQCPDINQLIIKKSLIELNNSKFCNNTFTSILLKDCPKIDCASLISISYNINSGKSGSIIGR